MCKQDELEVSTLSNTPRRMVFLFRTQKKKMHFLFCISPVQIRNNSYDERMREMCEAGVSTTSNIIVFIRVFCLCFDYVRK